MDKTIVTNMIHRLKLIKEVEKEIEEERTFKSNCYTLGLGDGPRIPITLFVENRRRLFKKMSSIDRLAVIYIEGGKFPNEYSDECLDSFTQEPFFFWLLGILEPNINAVFDVLEGQTYLFIPNECPDQKNFKSVCDELMKKYLVEFVESNDEILTTMNKFKRRTIYIPCGKSRDNRSIYNDIYCNHNTKILDTDFSFECKSLYTVLCELRTTKTATEIPVMSYLAGIGANGLRYVMSCIVPGMREFKATALYTLYVSEIGSCKSNKNNICLSSSNAGHILHYLHNQNNSGMLKDGDLCILDLGCNYFGYNASLSTTFPVNGTFNSNQKSLYEIVMAVREEIYNNLGRGITVNDLNKIGAKLLLEKLKVTYDILNYSAEDLYKGEVHKVFMPYRCCHFIGLEVEDVGEHDLAPCTEPQERAATSYLGAGKILVVGAGCFFVNHLIDRALESPHQKKYFRKEINKFRNFGGVILKDMVLITSSGYEILSDVPRSMEDIEDFLQDTQHNLPRKSTRRESGSPYRNTLNI